MATQEGFLEEVTFELTSKEQAGHREGLEEFQQRECQCKGPEVGESLVCLNRQEGKRGRGHRRVGGERVRGWGPIT